MPEGTLGSAVREAPDEKKVVTTTLNVSDGDSNVNVPGLSSIDHVVGEVEANLGTDMVQVVEGNAGTVDVTMTSISDGTASGNTNDCTIVAVGDP